MVAVTVAVGGRGQVELAGLDAGLALVDVGLDPPGPLGAGQVAVVVEGELQCDVVGAGDGGEAGVVVVGNPRDVLIVEGQDPADGVGDRLQVAEVVVGEGQGIAVAILDGTDEDVRTIDVIVVVVGAVLGGKEIAAGDLRQGPVLAALGIPDAVVVLENGAVDLDHGRQLRILGYLAGGVEPPLEIGDPGRHRAGVVGLGAEHLEAHIEAVAPAAPQRFEAARRILVVVAARKGELQPAALEFQVLPGEVEGAVLQHDVMHQGLAEHLGRGGALVQAARVVGCELRSGVG